MPELAVAVEDASVLEYAAVPTLGFRLRVDAGEAAVRALLLTAQIRIAATRRGYDADEQERLTELFGDPPRWGQTLRSLLWTHATLQVPPFAGSTTVELPVACTYDFEVVAAKYLNALTDGEVPLEFLFSGTIFYADPSGTLRVERVGWDKEAAFVLPLEVWRRAMEHYFPGTAWLRLRRDVFDRLYAYRARNAHPSWERTLEALLPPEERL